MRFRQTTQPTVRRDGTPLTDRDLWFKTDTGLWYRWNPTTSLWWSDQLFCAEIGRYAGQNAGTTYPIGSVLPNHDVWLEHFIYSGMIDTPTTATNYWRFQLKRREATDVVEFTQNLSAATANARFYVATNFQTFRSLVNATSYICVVDKFGSVGNLSHLYIALYYRLVPRGQ
jgi:hypothetical protein